MSIETINMALSILGVGLCVYGIGRGAYQLITKQRITSIMPGWVSTTIVGIWILAIVTGVIGIFQIVVLVLLGLMSIQLIPSIKQKKVCSVELNKIAVITSMVISLVVMLAIIL